MAQVNVLLVDDEFNVQKIVSGFLDRYGAEYDIPVNTKVLGDPVQGLFEVTANGGNYDMIMLDVRLPKVTGDEIYNSLSHVSPELLDRVLFITGFRADLDDRFPAQDLRVLDKPFRYRQLVDAIEAIVNPAPA
jgi:two-component system, LytTR family, response regulator